MLAAAAARKVQGRRMLRRWRLRGMERWQRSSTTVSVLAYLVLRMVWLVWLVCRRLCGMFEWDPRGKFVRDTRGIGDTVAVTSANW